MIPITGLYIFSACLIWIFVCQYFIFIVHCPFQNLIKKCDNEVDMLNRQQKNDVERLEMAQNAEHKGFVKKLKIDQVMQMRPLFYYLQLANVAIP